MPCVSRPRKMGDSDVQQGLPQYDRGFRCLEENTNLLLIWVAFYIKKFGPPNRFTLPTFYVLPSAPGPGVSNISSSPLVDESCPIRVCLKKIHMMDRGLTHTTLDQKPLEQKMWSPIAALGAAHGHCIFESTWFQASAWVGTSADILLSR